ncbi:hypothetical protein LSTR_LSTR016220 [Laodelphax striatellus]|uniref:Uncharacterized protein n=1 Tax=Laodelphax striatellus TaxID=195883 RepID=A0A482WZP9_LAOST|nr:hypothetical protein LSTR_LSTR016220 [Laodelphax striatellus]
MCVVLVAAEEPGVGRASRGELAAKVLLLRHQWRLVSEDVAVHALSTVVSRAMRLLSAVSTLFGRPVSQI